ncbi:hypothetical protein ABXS75_03035 [Roseburia hominis]
MMLSLPTTVSAAETNTNVSPDNREYLIVNGEDIVYVGEDYENPDTGEYIRWHNTRGTDKHFSFRISYSVTSSSFKINGTKVKVTANAEVQNLQEVTQSGYDGHLYTVSIIGIVNRNLQFSVGGTQSGTITGLQKGGSYKVKITNNDYLDATKKLVGSGTVYSY